MQNSSNGNPVATVPSVIASPRSMCANGFAAGRVPASAPATHGHFARRQNQS